MCGSELRTRAARLALVGAPASAVAGVEPWAGSAGRKRRRQREREGEESHVDLSGPTGDRQESSPDGPSLLPLGVSPGPDLAADAAGRAGAGRKVAPDPNRRRRYDIPVRILKPLLAVPVVLVALFTFGRSLLGQLRTRTPPA
jgi:hypothetical protein